MRSATTPSATAVTRRSFLTAVGSAVAAAAAGVSACAQREPLRLAMHSWPGYEFLRLASTLGWLAPAVVRVEPMPTFADSIAALRRGEVAAAGMTLDEVLRLRDAGIPAQVALVFDVSMGADVLLARPEIDSLAALRGRRIGVEPTTLGSLLLGRALAAGGLVRADVEVAALPGGHEAAWAAGSLDAVITSEPAAGHLRRLGAVPLFDSRQLPQLIVDVLAIRKDAPSWHAGALRAAIGGHFRALRRWRVNPIDTSYRLAQQLRVDPVDVADLYRGLDLPDALYNREYLTPPAKELTRASTELGRFLAADALLQRPVTAAGLFVPDYLPATPA